MLCRRRKCGVSADRGGGPCVRQRTQCSVPNARPDVWPRYGKTRRITSALWITIETRNPAQLSAGSGLSQRGRMMFGPRLILNHCAIAVTLTGIDTDGLPSPEDLVRPWPGYVGDRSPPTRSPSPELPNSSPGPREPAADGSRMPAEGRRGWGSLRIARPVTLRAHGAWP